MFAPNAPKKPKMTVKERRRARAAAKTRAQREHEEMMANSLPLPPTVADQQCALSDADIARATAMDAIIPPGARRLLINQLCYLRYELTNDPNDSLINKPQKSFTPDSVGAHVIDPTTTTTTTTTTTEQRRAEKKFLHALAFSHTTSSREVFQCTESTFHAVSGLHPLVDGIILDKPTADAIKDGGDPSFHCDAHGNVLAVFIMPKGWAQAFNANQTCHRCGRFPSPVRCEQCMHATFCSDFCLLAAKASSVHSDSVCDEFILAGIRNAMKKLEIRTVVEAALCERSEPATTATTTAS